MRLKSEIWQLITLDIIMHVIDLSFIIIAIASMETHIKLITIGI